MSTSVVCDNGTGYVKCGYNTENIPRYVFPAVVGFPVIRADVKQDSKVKIKDVMVGWEASDNRAYLSLKYPMENGIIRDWDCMTHLYNYTFGPDCMNLDCKDTRIMLTEPPSNPLKNRQKMAELMFEKYNFHSLYVAIQAVLTLYAQGLFTGIVLDSGDGVTHVCPVYEGCCIPNGILRLNLAGRDVSSRLLKLVQLRGYNLNSNADFQTVGEMKEKLCYVAYDIKKEIQLARETTFVKENYTLPDGRTISIEEERFMAPECLFCPSMLDIEQDGIHALCYDSINKCDIDVRPSLYKEINLSGGTTMLPGFPSRLERELKRLYLEKIGKNRRDTKIPINIKDPPYRKHLVFQGAAVLSGVIQKNDKAWVTQSEYKEQGISCLAKLK